MEKKAAKVDNNGFTPDAYTIKQSKKSKQKEDDFNHGGDTEDEEIPNNASSDRKLTKEKKEKKEKKSKSSHSRS